MFFQINQTVNESYGTEDDEKILEDSANDSANKALVVHACSVKVPDFDVPSFDLQVIYFCFSIILFF